MFRRCWMCAMTMLLIAGVWGSVWALTPEELLAIEAAARAAFNAHDVDAFVSYFTDDGVFDYVSAGVPMNGKEQIRAFFQSSFAAFPDYQDVNPPRRLASGNIVVTECRPTGTHLGEWMGIPPTGKSFQVPHLSISEYEGNKVKRLTCYDDAVSFMVQIGLMPAGELPPLVPSFTLPDPEPTGLSPVEGAAEQNVRWNANDLANWAKMFRSDAEIMVAALGTPMNRDAYVALQELYKLGFPDAHEQIVRSVDMGDGWVLFEAVYTGTQNGPYFGIPATGRSITMRGGVLLRYDAEGLITNCYAYFDNMTVLVQIGAIPGPTSVLPTTWGQIKATFQE